MSGLLLMLVAPAWADCAGDLDAALQRAEDAFAQGRAVAVVSATEAAEAAWSCLERPADPTTAARLHRAHALGAHLSGRPALDRLRAMRRADPFLAWTLAGPDHPLTLELHRAEESLGGDSRLLAEGAGWHVDGLPVPAVGGKLPVLVQLVDAGRVERSYESVGRRLPGAREGGRRGAGWTVAGLASGMIAAGFYGGAWAARGEYDRAVDARDDDRTLRMHGMTNGLTAASLGCAGLAATFVAVGISR